MFFAFGKIWWQPREVQNTEMSLVLSKCFAVPSMFCRCFVHSGTSKFTLVFHFRHCLVSTCLFLKLSNTCWLLLANHISKMGFAGAELLIRSIHDIALLFCWLKHETSIKYAPPHRYVQVKARTKRLFIGSPTSFLVFYPLPLTIILYEGNNKWMKLFLFWHGEYKSTIYR